MWRRIGFGNNSLVPIIEFLPGPLRDAAKIILRHYFRRFLATRMTVLAGHDHGNEFGLKFANSVYCIDSLTVNSAQNIDGLKIQFQVATHELNGKVSKPILVEEKYGWDRGPSWDKLITFPNRDEIVKLCCKVDSKRDNGIVTGIRFEMFSGASFPASGFYGSNPGDQEIEISAPRVRGIFGRSGKRAHSFGLVYLDLQEHAESRNFLLAIEAYLFEDRNYTYYEDFYI